MSALIFALRWLIRRFALVLVAGAVLSRARNAWRRRGEATAARRRARRSALPSLYDRHPAARTAARRRLGVSAIPLDAIVGTMRHPSQNTGDFLPLPALRGRNWQARWQRIQSGMKNLAVLPPVDLVKVGEEYYVEDGHNRVAAAADSGALEIDADVTELLLLGVATQPAQASPTTALVDNELRQAAAGRHSRAVEQRVRADEMSRTDLVRRVDPEALEE